jgi:hypothetical protein
MGDARLLVIADVLLDPILVSRARQRPGLFRPFNGRAVLRGVISAGSIMWRHVLSNWL